MISTVTLTPELVPFLDACWLKPGAAAIVVDLAASWINASMPIFNRIIIDDSEQEAQMVTPLVDPDLVVVSSNMK